MVVTKAKQFAGWSVVPYRPEVGNVVACVVRICRVDEEKTPFIFIVLLGKDYTGSVNCALDTRLEAGTELYVMYMSFTLAPATFKTRFARSRH